MRRGLLALTVLAACFVGAAHVYSTDSSLQADGWATPVVLSSASEWIGDVSLAASADGTVHVVWDDGGTLKKKTLDIDGTEGSFARNKKEIRNRLKRLMVRTVLGRESRAVLPWGTLTGIKPSKLVHDMLDTGATEGAIRQRLKTDYLLAPEKIDLVMAVAGRERSLIYPPDPGKVSVYIGISISLVIF